MFAVQTVGSFSYIFFTVLTPFFKSAFDVSTGAVGVLVTLLYVGFLVSLTPGGILTDHAGERFTLAASMTGVVVVVAPLKRIDGWSAGSVLSV